MSLSGQEHCTAPLLRFRAPGGTFALLLLLLSAPAPESRRRVCATTPYRYLALEGGGVKGIAYGGALRGLDDAGVLESIEGFAGSSAGSSAAVLLAAGFSGEEVLEELMVMDFRELLHMSADDLGATAAAAAAAAAAAEAATGARGSPSWRDRLHLPGVPRSLKNLRRFLGRFGWHTSEGLGAVIDELIFKKTGLARATFQDLYDKTGKSLKLTGTSVTTGQLKWFSAATTPRMRVSLAVRASSSIPFFFEPIEYDGELFVDGGALRNLPMDAFDGNQQQQQQQQQQGRQEDAVGAGSTLALSLRRENKFQLSRGASVARDFSHVGAFAMRLLDIMLWGPESANSLLVDMDSLTLDIVKIDAGNISAVSFGLSETEKAGLVQSGFKAVKQLLADCGDTHGSGHHGNATSGGGGGGGGGGAAPAAGDDNDDDPEWLRALVTAAQAEDGSPGPKTDADAAAGADDDRRPSTEVESRRFEGLGAQLTDMFDAVVAYMNAKKAFVKAKRVLSCTLRFVCDGSDANINSAEATTVAGDARTRQLPATIAGSALLAVALCVLALATLAAPSNTNP